MMTPDNHQAAVVDEMLDFVPTAIPGAVSLARASRSPWDGYTLRYLRPSADDITGDSPTAPSMDARSVRIAAAWSGFFAVGLMLILFGVALGVLVPLTTHARGLWLTLIAVVLVGLAALARSRFTPIAPDRLSIASAIMRLRLDALVATHEPYDYEARLREENEISDRLLAMATCTRSKGPRSWGSNKSLTQASDTRAEGQVTGPPDSDDTWEQRLKQRKIYFVDLVQLKYAQTGRNDRITKDQGNKFYDRALDVFRSENQGSGLTTGYDVNAAIFSDAASGIYISPDGKVWSTVLERAIGFDWSEGQLLLNRAEILDRRVRELWGIEATEFDQAPTRGSGVSGWFAARFSRVNRARKILERRRPYCEMAYNFGSQVLSAVNLEMDERLKKQKALRDDEQLPMTPSESFPKKLAAIRTELELAEREFLRAAQRHARLFYAYGMLAGTVLLALVLAGLAIIFESHKVPAWYGIAALTGGIGAIVSVLQRMAKRKLLLEYDAGAGMLVTLGGVRPLIGAIFGMVLFAVFHGGWLPSISVSATKPLAFYAVLGFLAGFNERFAQDMLVASAATLGSTSGEAAHVHSAASPAQMALAAGADPQPAPDRPPLGA